MLNWKLGRRSTNQTRTLGLPSESRACEIWGPGNETTFRDHRSTPYVTTPTMADIRAMLRSELASRRADPATNRYTTKKRKLPPDADPGRKKAKSASASRPASPDSSSAPLEQPPSQPYFGENTNVAIQPPPQIPSDPTSAVAQGPQPTSSDQATVDEDEWAAFERDVVVPTKLPPAQLQLPPALDAARTAGVTISAAPISAAELAEQETEDRERRQVTDRDAEQLGEKEDAERFLEDEFDQMDQLEERVRRLKEKREEIRRRNIEEAKVAIPNVDVEQTLDKQSETDDGEEDYDDSWDNWRR